LFQQKSKMMKRMINASYGLNEKEKKLWQRISDFPIDDPDAKFPFSRKLAKEQKWTYDFTLGAIQEYRKFIFLCCISPLGAAPSQVIDEVWHLHLIYTENYWEEFCEKTLNMKIHHHPSSGGPQQKDKHILWHLDTLEQYRSIFNHAPPPAYWIDERFITSANYFFKSLLKKTLRFGLLIPLLFLAGCDGGVVSGLAIFMVIIIVTGISSLAASRNTEDRQKDQSGGYSCSSGSGSGGCGSSCSGGGCGGGCGGCGGS
jgi:hypothetical protein